MWAAQLSSKEVGCRVTQLILSAPAALRWATQERKARIPDMPSSIGFDVQKQACSKLSAITKLGCINVTFGWPLGVFLAFLLLPIFYEKNHQSFLSGAIGNNLQLHSIAFFYVTANECRELYLDPMFPCSIVLISTHLSQKNTIHLINYLLLWINFCANSSQFLYNLMPLLYVSTHHHWPVANWAWWGCCTRFWWPAMCLCWKAGYMPLCLLILLCWTGSVTRSTCGRGQVGCKSVTYTYVYDKQTAI